ncbi:uncharacterized protein DNG_06222 [Cephalotrichum gorgonifer]|uniref:Septation initiation network scaffold protein cdc11 n=1 Tax=Cephalotrichum gorgonifer TaxID=2041049 RepID=A0AAE8SWE3_9PEZI|nr:uncharacterized protein DNG_06222 [Cephalotrichum gorgonifer]
MDHAWLDSLSEDWVSQPRSDESIAQMSSAQHPETENENQQRPNITGKGLGSRIPRPVGALDTNDNSAHPLAERSLSYINISGPRRGQPKDSKDRPASRSVSAATTNSVVHYTVNRRSPSASPGKAKGHTPEWKRRLVYGDLAYGEQRDLFHSAAADGLGGIFKPPTPQDWVDGLGDAEDPFVEGDSNHNETTLPSSPPVYRAPPAFDESDAPDDDSEVGPADVTPSPSPRRSYKDIVYHLNEDPALDRSPSDFRIHQDNSPDESDFADEMAPPVEQSERALQPPQNELRMVSGQSVVRNEDFSPIFISRQDAADGQVGFAPMDLPVDQLRARLERLHTNQMLLDSYLDGDLALDDQPDSENAAATVDNTDEYMRNGGFLNLQRGGRSAEGSFRHRLLSPPALGNDSSEMLPEESMQASTPKQFPSVKSRLGGHGGTMGRSPLVPRAPHPSPDKRIPGPQASGGSPLKLFGPYDTFTNQTLMRRISQFEEQMTHSNSEKSFNTNPFRSSSFDATSRREQHPTQNGRQGSKSFSRFGDGELEGFEFGGDVSGLSMEGSRLDFNADISQQENIPPAYSNDQASSPSVESELVIQRQRQKSGGPLSSSQHGRAVSGSRLNMSQAGAHVYLGTPKRDSGSDGKRPRASPSKDPTPKRRRTLHKTDIAYGKDREAVNVDSVHTSHHDMQAAIGKKTKSGDLQQAVNPDVLAHRQMPRPRTPTPSQRSSLQRDTVPSYSYGDLSVDNKVKRSPLRNVQHSPGKPQQSAGGDMERKPSIMTADFLDEAAQIMAMIRNQVRPTNLTMVQESEAEQVHDGGFHGEEDSFEEPFSRPPSRDGAPLTRMAIRQSDPEILDRLKKYQEMSEMGDVITSSLRSMSLAKEAVRSMQELREGGRTNLSTGGEEFSDPPNIRISQGITESGATTTGAATFPSTSSGASSGSIPTNSSRTSECKKTIAPQSVSHLIPDQVGSMYLDKSKNLWVKKKALAAVISESMVDESEDDPFASIPDLSVDMTLEMRNLKAAVAKQQAATEDMEGSPSPSSPPKAFGGPTKGLNTLSADQDADEDVVSRARDELLKLERKVASSPIREEEVIEHEITINEGRGKSRTPSKRRNLTISFSSPVASIIRDVLPEDINALSEDEDYTPELPGDSGEGLNGGVPGSWGKHAAAPGSRKGARGFTRQTSVGRVSFTPRPVSRIDEQDEESTRDADRQVSFVGGSSAVEHVTPDARRTSLSFIIKPSGGRYEDDASAVIGQNIGNLSLSPLSEFTMNNAVDQSFGLEVSYVLGERHLVSGDGSKKVMSIAIRELVDRLTEAEPSEPFWDSLVSLDLQDKRLSSLHMLDEFCGTLVNLDASKNALTHLDGVPSGVRQLKVCDNMLSELTSWDHLMNLQYVDVSNNDLRSLSALKNLVHLRSIRADDNLLTGLDGLDELDGLLSLRVRNNRIEELDFEGSRLQRLSELDLAGNKIKSLENVEQLSSLSTLKLQRNQLETFASAGKFESLRYLDISDNSLHALDLTNMPKLRLLHADRNNLSTIAGLTHARHIDSLSLREQRGDEPLNVASLLATAYEVRKLFLSGNYINTFAPKIDLLNLQLLELASCGLRELPPSMGQLTPNLRSLNICFNAISDLEPLRFVPRLKRLLAAGNRLADGTRVMGVAAGFPHLREVDLRDNPLTLGFYPPSQVLVAPDAERVEGFGLPAGDAERDRKFRGRLDEATKLRRRLYEIVFVCGCEKMRVLDGLGVKRGEVMKRDEAFEMLVGDGLIPGGDRCEGSGEAEEEEERREQRGEGGDEC